MSMAACAAQFKIKITTAAGARPLVRACNLEVRSRPQNTNVAVKAKALLDYGPWAVR